MRVWMSRVARENLWNEVISHKVASYAEGVRIHLAEAARVEKLAARVTKQSFREWTDANLFRPLGMTRTHFCDDAAEIVPHRAAYYTSEAKGQLHEFVSQLAAPGSSPSSAVRRTDSLICNGLCILNPRFLHYIFDCFFNNPALLRQVKTQALQEFGHHAFGP